MIRERAQIVAISNQKGGVAKTTTCLSFGASLAELGRPTLVVDLDPQANLTLGFGREPEDLPLSIADLLATPDTITARERDSLVLHGAPDGLDLLPADIRLAAFEREAGEIENAEGLLAEALTPWLHLYEHILIDCPPSLGPLTHMAFNACDRVLVPVQCEYFSSWGLMRLLDVTGAMRRGRTSGLICHLLAVMYDPRSAVCQNVYQRIKKNFPQLLLRTTIGLDTLLRESELVGETILVYAPHSRASEEYRKLAKEWISRTQDAEG